ncbi:hypothetical protein BOTBODRAFT_178673 [Botryobasidium botryosum FD-172 SS1]|uniref:Protein phosphatase methylesterase 1 n=1 Tax=Botryobasidium botryosum (strain FD-172 SS1) TaxID=930990 RepID=A0A067M320_BOTB1|nr:hypothetical protein BOTBODRAFT_178673 [Botryobasidium botryosum FD-172 SS1]
MPPGSEEHEDFEDEEGEEGADQDDIGPLPSRSMDSPGSTRFARNRKSRVADFSAFAPLSAAQHFAQAFEVNVPTRDLLSRVYYTPPKVNVGANEGPGTVVVCHHGAGYSGLSFACLASAVKDAGEEELGFLAFDARGHGKTTLLSSAESGEPEPVDFSLATLAEDLVGLLKTVFPDPSISPTLLMVGHSMGGSVVVSAVPILLSSGYRIVGAAVLDVVEGTAVEALPFMHSFLDKRPEGFQSVEEAISWHVSGNTIRNAVSARTSVPSTLVASPSSDPAWRWRTPLRSTAPFWDGWYGGLSSKFLAVRTARLLILAGAERLDKTLMIGQMQGKFQLVVLGDVGHMLHEDDPERVAEVLVEFWKRNDRVIAGIKKVGDL